MSPRPPIGDVGRIEAGGSIIVMCLQRVEWSRVVI